MPELRKNPITQEWVIIAKERAKRPHDFEKKKKPKRENIPNCPFCPGNESLTPPEITAYRLPGTQPDTPGWQVRVVPNKYPALELKGNNNLTQMGIYQLMNGYGAHEVVIDTPYHHKSMGNLTTEETQAVVKMYCDRYNDLKKITILKYILVFKNYGPAAGTSIEHLHSQILATPVVPKQVMRELKGATQYFKEHQNCAYCDIIKAEAGKTEHTVLESDHFIVIEPFFSKLPFETWIIPKSHHPCFAQMTNYQLNDFAQLLTQTIAKIEVALADPPYNYTFHTVPIHEEDNQTFHWHFIIIPRLTILGGFELGTGIFINVTVPEEAAKYLRKAKINN